MNEIQQRTVGEIMTAQVTALSVEERLDLAEDIMHVGRVRHMPVVDGKRLVGILSARDLLAAALSQERDFKPEHRRAFLRTLVAEKVMVRDPETATPETTLAAAAARMCERKIGCLPVVDDEGELVGLVTETDLVRAAYLEEHDPLGVLALDRARRGIREVTARFRDEVDALRRTREELSVRLHLGKADAADRWEELEGKWRELERLATTVADEAREPIRELREAADDLAGDLRRGYRRLRRTLVA